MNLQESLLWKSHRPLNASNPLDSHIVSLLSNHTLAVFPPFAHLQHFASSFAAPLYSRLSSRVPKRSSLTGVKEYQRLA
ncbi:uncharacterized protein CANTADRAFT_139961 [Suhomyces tanzawaensis NRRL Y-17324]|uniref:Uncharacterized protein n=1 Tax=Suhomyces tanzawaensis NRRL Y-17324 TaxID=984487 RepID=A0A1E4SS03_9ASCO|nr:uncharacterized protein CANTADRAFT_139961 [Suhomyces tanzawaensis NRRL Y-17324]ODV82299.1 hypothetical protein CANTADRAFT_139961 [Suhomyces tanzawaensis NRRL Y-17324]